MEGLYFYWFSWVFWVVVTFLMKKGKLRTLLAYWILLSIVFSNNYLRIDNISLSVTFILVFLGGFVLLARIIHSFYHLFAAFTLMIGYAGFLIWEQLAPVWLFIPRIILLPLILAMLISILTNHLLNRITIGIIGICAGELLYSLLLFSYQITNTVGEKGFFDTLVICLFLLMSVHLMKRIKMKVLQTSQIYRQSLRWQNE